MKNFWGVSFVCLVEDELNRMDVDAIGRDYGLEAQVQALSPLPSPLLRDKNKKWVYLSTLEMLPNLI